MTNTLEDTADFNLDPTGQKEKTLFSQKLYITLNKYVLEVLKCQNSQIKRTQDFFIFLELCGRFLEGAEGECVSVGDFHSNWDF